MPLDGLFWDTPRAGSGGERTHGGSELPVGPRQLLEDAELIVAREFEEARGEATGP